MQCPECGTTGMTKYSKQSVDDSLALWTCVQCGWIGKEQQIKERETDIARRFVKMCEESVCPEHFEMLEDHIIPDIERARRIVVAGRK